MASKYNSQAFRWRICQNEADFIFPMGAWAPKHPQSRSLWLLLLHVRTVSD